MDIYEKHKTENINNLIYSLCKAINTTKEIILNSKSNNEVARNRLIIYCLVYKLTPLTQDGTAKILNVANKSTISQSVKEFEYKYLNNDVFKKTVDRIINLINN